MELSVDWSFLREAQGTGTGTGEGTARALQGGVTQREQEASLYTRGRGESQ